MEPTFEARVVDITTLSLDAIVNAANPSLLGGGGVDGAIHRRAGAGLLAECERLPVDDNGERCPVGQARLTGAHRLPCRYVVHTVGPVWADHEPLEADHLLAACYRNSLWVANGRGVKSIAFPCISTGAYGFPGPRAAQIAVSTVRQSLRSLTGITHCVFACFQERDLWSYQQHLRTSG